MSGENWSTGPWFVNPTPLADGRARVEDGQENGLEAIKCEWSEAHLIAAAPDLYTSNEWLLDAVMKLASMDKPVRDLDERVEYAKRASAKARGENPCQ